MLVNLFILKFALKVRLSFGMVALAFISIHSLVLSMIGWISIYDLRFGRDYTDSENFSSILSLALANFFHLIRTIHFCVSLLQTQTIKGFQ